MADLYDSPPEAVTVMRKALVAADLRVNHHKARTILIAMEAQGVMLRPLIDPPTNIETRERARIGNGYAWKSWIAWSRHLPSG